MASINELKDVLKESLEEKGVLQEIRAQIRSEIFKTLDDNKQKKKTKLNEEQLIINEIIREYLIHNNLIHTLSVFLPESGTPEKVQYDRDYIQKKLKVVEDEESQSLPLIYGLTFGLKKIIADQPNVTNNFLNFNRTNNELPSKNNLLPNQNYQQNNISKNIFNMYEEKQEPVEFNVNKDYF